MSSKEELERRLEEQRTQLTNYETKLKNVVQAYKSLETEKKSLEVALEALSCPPTSESASKPDGDESVESGPPPPGECSEGRLEALKQALATLTVENKKKELAFQSDRRALIVLALNCVHVRLFRVFF